MPSSWKGSRGSVKSPNIGRGSFRHRLALKGSQGPFAILKSLSPRFHLEHLHSWPFVQKQMVSGKIITYRFYSLGGLGITGRLGGAHDERGDCSLRNETS